MIYDVHRISISGFGFKEIYTWELIFFFLSLMLLLLYSLSLFLSRQFGMWSHTQFTKISFLMTEKKFDTQIKKNQLNFLFCSLWLKWIFCAFSAHFTFWEKKIREEIDFATIKFDLLSFLFAFNYLFFFTSTSISHSEKLLFKCESDESN